MAKNNAIVIGSLSQIAARDGCSLAESFMSAEIILLVDESGSMSTCDATGGLSRYQAAENDVIHLQEKYQGKVALISFSDVVQFCPTGVPIRFGGGTDMVKALDYVKCADDTGIKIILISDGLPNDKEGTLKIAKTFKSKLDVVFIGSEQDLEGGREFLKKLSNATGGTFYNSKSPGLLETSVKMILENNS